MSPSGGRHLKFFSCAAVLIIKVEQRIFTHFHRQLFCWIDKWIDLSMEDIRRMEEDTKKELDDVRTLCRRTLLAYYHSKSIYVSFHH